MPKITETPSILNLSAISEKLPRIHESIPAKEAIDVIVEEIQKLQDGLDNDQEITVMLASFGQSVTMDVDTIGNRGPHCVLFAGTINGTPARLIQHLSQLSFLLLVQKSGSSKPARRIGFYIDQCTTE